ncbi:MAG: hypothetical protein IT324_02055 [Anaerolineae bacterium]|nr:hypothetical protein [Anaerolineae bacterium]
MSTDFILVNGAVEGLIDEAVLRRLIVDVGAVPGTIYGMSGKAHLLKRLKAYNHAAAFNRWVILIDLDQDAVCAPSFCAMHLPEPAVQLCFRVAVRAVEAWLLADRERMAQFLAVPMSQVPHNPEALVDPKQTMVQLARQSRKKVIREDMVPRQGSSNREGTAYASRLMEFVGDTDDGWRPAIAAESADSLRRCLDCLHRLIAPSP